MSSDTNYKTTFDFYFIDCYNNEDLTHYQGLFEELLDESIDMRASFVPNQAVKRKGKKRAKIAKLINSIFKGKDPGVTTLFELDKEDIVELPSSGVTNGLPPMSSQDSELQYNPWNEDNQQTTYIISDGYITQTKNEWKENKTNNSKPTVESEFTIKIADLINEFITTNCKRNEQTTFQHKKNTEEDEKEFFKAVQKFILKWELENNGKYPHQRLNNRELNQKNKDLDNLRKFHLESNCTNYIKLQKDHWATLRLSPHINKRERILNGAQKTCNYGLKATKRTGVVLRKLAHDLNRFQFFVGDRILGWIFDNKYCYFALVQVGGMIINRSFSYRAPVLID